MEKFNNLELNDMKIYCLAFIVSLLYSCASPHKNFEKGNYDKAYSGVLKELEKGSKSRKDKNILNKSFDSMLRQEMTDTELHMRSSDVRDWERVYSSHEKLIKDYIKGKRWLNNDFSEIMQKIEIDQDTLALNIADAYILDGNSLMNNYNLNGNKGIAKEAHKLFLRAQKYGYYEDELIKLTLESLNAATIYTLVESNSWNPLMKGKIDSRFREIERESNIYFQVLYNDSPNYVDCYIGLHFNDLDIKDSRNITTDNYSKEIVDSYKTYIDSSGVKQSIPNYKTIKASVKCITELKIYRWNARVRIDRKFNYCDHHPQTINVKYEMVSKTYSIQGNREALPDNLKNLKNEYFPINERQVIENLLDDLYKQFKREYF